MSKIKATYFDGVSSKPKTIWISVYSASQLRLYASEDELRAFEEWDVLHIKKDSFNSSNALQLSYTDNELKKNVEIAEANEQLNAFVKCIHTHETRMFDFVLKRSALKVITSGILTLSLLIFIYVKWVSVAVGSAIVSIIPPSVEETIGTAAFNQMNPILSIDSSKSELLQTFYDELNFKSTYEISVFYDTRNTVNAFALPGGKIVVFDGLIQKTESWEELAALFGHELSHVNQRHSMRLMSRELGNYAVFSALTGDMAGISSVLVESAISLNELVYSRTYEKQADQEGLQILVENNIEPAAMMRLFERIFEENKNVEDFMKNLEMLSTHPLTDKRMDYIKEWITKEGLTEHQGEENEKAKGLWLKMKE